MARAGLHTVASSRVNAPIFEEFPITLECRLLRVTEEGVVGEILNVCADERVLDGAGQIDPSKVEAITYDPVGHTYIKLGNVVGHAFSDGMRLK